MGFIKDTFATLKVSYLIRQYIFGIIFYIVLVTFASVGATGYILFVSI